MLHSVKLPANVPGNSLSSCVSATASTGAWHCFRQFCPAPLPNALHTTADGAKNYCQQWCHALALDIALALRISTSDSAKQYHQHWREALLPAMALSTAALDLAVVLSTGARICATH
jgi:threonine synthase